MMSIETRINGILINYMSIVREVNLPEGFYLYDIEYFRPERSPKILEFQVRHKREEGAEKLALIIYQKVNKLLGKK
jgi:hypothetical protein